MFLGKTYTLEIEGFSIYKEQLAGTLSKSLYKEIIFAYNKECIRQVIEEAKYFPLGSHFSGLRVIRVNRNYNSPSNNAVNWKESLKLKQKYLDSNIPILSKENSEGKPWIVKYSLDDDQYVMFFWNCYLPANYSEVNVNRVLMYKFIPSRGKTGIKTQLKDFVNNKLKNPLGIYKYPHTKSVSKRKRK